MTERCAEHVTSSGILRDVVENTCNFLILLPVFVDESFGRQVHWPAAGIFVWAGVIRCDQLREVSASFLSGFHIGELVVEFLLHPRQLRGG